MYLPPRQTSSKKERDARETEDGAPVVVGASFDVRVSEEKDGENNRNHVPTREDEARSPAVSIAQQTESDRGRDIRESAMLHRYLPNRVERRKSEHRRRLNQTHLQRIRRTDLHSVHPVSL